MRRSVLVIAAACLAVLAAGALALYLYVRPTDLRVAVPRGSVDHQLLVEAARLLRSERAAVRFHIVPVNNAAAGAKALDSGQAELAVIGSHQAMPVSGKTVVILRRHAAIIVAPGNAGINAIADLRQKSIGIVSDSPADPGIENILDTILARHEISGQTITRKHLLPAEAESALASGDIQALFAVGLAGDGLIADAVAAAARAGEGEPIFISPGHTSALAQQSQALEQYSVLAGTFPGPLARPAQDLDTIAISIRLFASSNLRDGLVGDIARAIFALKPRLIAANPIALRIQAPSTSKDANLPTHPGAAAYLDSEEVSIFDRFSEMFYLGAMVISVLGSAVAAVATHLGSQSKREFRALTGRLMEVLRLARLADEPALLKLLQAEADSIFADFTSMAAAGRHDEQRIATIGLIMNQFQTIVREKAAFLASGPDAARKAS